jgi:uncharacterized protein
VKNRPRTGMRERRVFDIEDLEIRADDGKPPEIHGHAIRYGVWSQDLGGFRERIMPGAARKTITESDIRALFNHDPNYVLGRNKAGTLDLSEDDRGLRNVIRPPETQTIGDLVIEPMRRGDITQQSFGFRTIRDEWREPAQATKKDGLWERDVLELQLFDVSIVTFPAFTQASAHVRSTLGELDGIGIDWPALTALLTRAERGISLSDADADLIEASVAVLRSYLPTPAPDPVSDDQGSTRTSPDAGPPVDHLRRLLDMELEEHAFSR